MPTAEEAMVESIINPRRLLWKLLLLLAL